MKYINQGDTITIEGLVRNSNGNLCFDKQKSEKRKLKDEYLGRCKQVRLTVLDECKGR